MKRTLIRAALVLSLGIGIAATWASADPLKGEKVVNNALHGDCAMPTPRVAMQHSQKEWDAIFKSGQMEAEIAKLCQHKTPIKPFNTKYAKNVFEFLEHYANDSGAVPA